MKEVKQIEKGNYILTHSWVYDDFGLKRNSFDLFDKVNRIHRPFIGMIRVSNYNPDEAIKGDDVSPYTDEQYNEMFEEQLTEIKNYD